MRIVITLLEALRERLGPEGSRALVDLSNETARGTRDDLISIAEKRFERRLAEVEARLTRGIAALRSGLMRWMFVFWIGQVGVLLGVLFVFFKP